MATHKCKHQGDGLNMADTDSRHRRQAEEGRKKITHLWSQVAETGQSRWPVSVPSLVLSKQRLPQHCIMSCIFTVTGRGREGEQEGRE